MPGLLEALKDNTDKSADCGMNIEEHTDVEEVIENILETFYKHIENGSYKKAIALYEMAERRWPEHFCTSELKENDQEQQESDGKDEG